MKFRMKIIIYFICFCPLLMNGQDLPQTAIKNIEINLHMIAVSDSVKHYLHNKIIESEYVKKNNILYFNIFIYKYNDSYKLVVTPNKNKVYENENIFGYFKCGNLTFFVFGNDTLLKKTNITRQFSMIKEVMKLQDEEIILPTLVDVPTWSFAIIGDSIYFDNFIEQW